MLTLFLRADQHKDAICWLGAFDANLEAAVGALLGFVRTKVTKIGYVMQRTLPMTTGE
jgi:hypothetical protein